MSRADQPALTLATVPAEAGVLIRPSRDGDVAAIQAIYAHHVHTSTATFEEQAPSCAEMAARRSSVAERGLPFLVVECRGVVRGFAYAAPFRPRSAYRFTVEDSIYIDATVTGAGLGRLLLGALIDDCTRLGLRQMVAAIGDSSNVRSIRLHARFGFAEAGALRSVGFKFGRWLDIVFMQRPLITAAAAAE
jgi:phosphinothricin acetyltransferase